MIDYFAGCLTVAIIWVLWHYQVIQPKLDQLKQMAEAKLTGKPPAA